MTLKYKLDDLVVIGENVESDHEEYFTPGVLVRIADLCAEGSVDEHYTISRVDGKGGAWWVYDNEINHNATEELQKSNEMGDIVGKIESVSDDNAKEVQTPVLEENAPQMALQSLVESSFSNAYSNAYSTAYNSVSVLHKSNNEECLKITIDGDILVFQQECYGDIQEICIDFDAMGVVFSAANELIVQYKEKK